MANEIRLKWGSSAGLTVTNLASLADGNIWQSGSQSNSSPSQRLLKVSYKIEFNATPVSGDYLAFYIATSDDNGTPLWDGGIGTSEGQITSAASKAAVLSALIEVHRHAWRTSMGAVFQGSFIVEIEPTWQLLVVPNGEALKASGHTINIRYATEEVQ